MKVIRREAARLERLIADILNLARLNQQQFDIHPDTVDLTEIARESATRHAACARDLGVRIELQQGGSAPARADPDRLLQAVSNLVENALRCTPPGGTVTLAAARGELTVKDTGPGISPEEIPHAFDRFFLYRGIGAIALLVPVSGWRSSASSRRQWEVTPVWPPRRAGRIRDLPSAPRERERARALHAFT